MKLLIVDDEKLTREGLCSSIDCEKLGIDEILHADDGINGLSLAKSHQPDIVLSDVRMPRMNGITMAEQIQELYPDTAIIFMSGYSDKEYLKAAIKLKAVSYVEKPIDMQEIEETLQEAIESREFMRRAKRSEWLRHQESKGKLATMMLYSQKDIDELNSYIKMLDLKFEEKENVYTMIIRFLDYPWAAHEQELKDMIDQFTEVVKIQKCKLIYTYKYEDCLIFHVYGERAENQKMKETLCDFWMKELTSKCQFFITFGKTVKGPYQAYESYNDAVILLQRGFFNEPCMILREMETVSIPIYHERMEAWKQMLRHGTLEECMGFADEIYADLKLRQNMLPNQIKDIYYKYLIQVEKEMNSDEKHNGIIWEEVGKCCILKELQQLLQKQLEILFEGYDKAKDENPIIQQIKDFVCQNCAVETLSVKDISEHVYLSLSYVCTFFKNETGQTLNQYITECRIERAKEMLADARYKISDISAAVGYKDGNYFAKAFKKNVGLSPSEYREKML